MIFQIVAPGNFITPLIEAFQVENHQNYRDKLFFNFCEHVEESIRWIRDNGSPPDFIVIVVDPTNKTGFDLVSKNVLVS